MPWILVAACGPMAAGCLPPPARERPVPFLVAVRYPVETVCLAEEDDPVARIGRDFERIRELGFNGVLAAHVPDDRRDWVVQAARTQVLTLILSDPVLRRFCLAAPTNSPFIDLENRLRAAAPIDADPLPRILYLGDVADDAVARQAAELTARAAEWVPHLPIAATLRADVPLPRDCLQRVIPVVRVSPPAEPPGTFTPPARLPKPGLVSIPVSGPSEDLTESVRAWLGMYHAGLSAGATEGVILDAWAEVRGRQEGLVDGEDNVVIARAAAVKRIIHRAWAWAPRLRGSFVGTLDGWQCHDRQLRVTLFAKKNRRWALVWNASSVRYVRSELSLPAEAGGASADRAVEVPGDLGVVGGRVFDARRGRITIPLELPPGDAILVELFSARRGPSRPD